MLWCREKQVGGSGNDKREGDPEQSASDPEYIRPALERE